MLTHCFNLLVDITAVEDVMEIQEVELIKTDGCSLTLILRNAMMRVREIR